MKKTYFYFVLCFVSAFIAKSQSYTVGNLTVNVMPNFSHDSTACYSSCMFAYGIQKNNSFLNDTVFIKDPSSGQVLHAFVNTTGNVTWTDVAVIPQLMSFLPDLNLMQPGNQATYFAPPTKAISGVDTIYNINNYAGTTIVDACSFNTVNGNLYVDQNADCIFNAGDIPLQNVNVSANAVLSSTSPTSAGFSAYSNSSGNYSMLVQQSWLVSYNVMMPSQYQFIFPLTTCSPIVYNFTTLPQNNVDFSLQCGSVVDVQTWIGSQGFARPLLPFSLSPVVSNTGCDSASGVLKLVLDSRVVYTASLSTNPATSVNGDTLYWNYTNLTNLSSGAYWNSFFAGVYLTPNGSVTAGDTLCFKSIINIPSNDLNPANNVYSMCIPVVNSHDPNFKEVTPAGVGVNGDIPASTQDLTYTIHFQNTGNGAAYNVNVVDTLSANVDASSLQIIESSHAMTPSWIAPGVVQFNFPNIFLADSASNEPASHGFVTFKVKLNSALSPGTQIANRGDIYFDNNSAILTNIALNTIQAGAGLAENTKSSFDVFPNPASDKITVRFSDSGSGSVVLNDILGNEVRHIKVSGGKVEIGTENLESGVYFVSVIRDNERTTKKILISK